MCRRKPARQPFCCEGLVEGQFVNDIVLDTGCSRTLVRGDLVRQEKLSLERTVTVYCAHGNVVVPCCYSGDQCAGESSFCGGSGVRQAATFSVVGN